MKTTFLFLLVLTFPFSQSFAGLGEDSHTFDANEFVLKNYIKSFETLLDQRVGRYNKEGLTWLQANLKTKEDKDLIKTQLAQTNTKTLSLIKKRDHYWVMSTAGHKISFSSADILLSRVYVDGKIFQLNPKETLPAFQERLLKTIREERKSTSFLNYLIPEANAAWPYDKKRVEQLVVLNATGVISVTYDEPWWFEVPNYARDLALAMSEEINSAHKECRDKSEELSKWNSRRMGNGLKKIVNSLKTNGRIDHSKLISSLMKKFSTKNAIDHESANSHGKLKAISGSCEQMMYGWKLFPQSTTSPLGDGLTYRSWVEGQSVKGDGSVDAKTGLCSAVKQTVACLENLDAIESKNIANHTIGTTKDVNLEKDTVFDEVNGSNSATRAK